MNTKLLEENTWPCPSCKNINKGDRKRCLHCSEYKPNDIEEELKNTKEQGMAEGNGMQDHGDMDDDVYGEGRYRPSGMGRGRGGFGGGRSNFGGRGGSGGRGGGRGGNNRGPPNRGPPLRRGNSGGYAGGGRYGPPGGYDGDMGGPDGYMADFRNGPPRGMMRGGSGARPGGFGGPQGAPHQRGPGGRNNYMDDPFEDEIGGQGRQPNYGENYRERSRSQEKTHEGQGS